MKYLITVVVIFFIACSDENSDKNPLEPEPMYSSINVAESSSSIAVESSSDGNVAESSSSIAVESSSDGNVAESSSSIAVESSSGGNVVESSSSLVVESSSDGNVVESSSSIAVESSSDGNVAESSSSLAVESSSDGNVAESSSSLAVESSSDGNVAESSSSLAVESSSSVVEENSSSSLVFTGVCKTATEDNCVYGTLYDDRDGKTYKTVKIGDQEWMAENLNYEVTGINKTTIRSKCYENSVDSCEKYGRYYTWTAVIDSISLYEKYSLECGYGKTCSTLKNDKIQGICPNGWHLPSRGEWETLSNFIGSSNAGTILKSMWENWNGTDSFGFSVLPLGVVENGSVGYIGERAYFWTRTDEDNITVRSAVFFAKSSGIQYYPSSKSAVEAIMVRCVKD